MSSNFSTKSSLLINSFLDILNGVLGLGFLSDGSMLCTLSRFVGFAKSDPLRSSWSSFIQSSAGSCGVCGIS